MSGLSDDLWRQLGIAPTAEESAIRRAYAKRLREVRPDDDPEGFQRLVEARDLALQLARHGGAGETERGELADEGAAELLASPQAGEARSGPASLPTDSPGADERRRDGKKEPPFSTSSTSRCANRTVQAPPARRG
jgi:hypothetical protein